MCYWYATLIALLVQLTMWEWSPYIYLFFSCSGAGPCTFFFIRKVMNSFTFGIWTELTIVTHHLENRGCFKTEPFCFATAMVLRMSTQLATMWQWNVVLLVQNVVKIKLNINYIDLYIEIYEEINSENSKLFEAVETVLIPFRNGKRTNSTTSKIKFSEIIFKDIIYTYINAYKHMQKQ